MRPVALAAVTAACLAACSDANNLPDPIFRNSEDTVEVFSLSGTDVFRPSGYSITERRAVRLDQSSNIDFAFDVTPDSRHIFLPGRMVAQAGNGGLDPGLLATSENFDSIKVAQTNGYITLDTVDVTVDNVFYIRSRIPSNCFLGLPSYGKLQILEFNDEQRTVKFRVLNNLNCGYKGLTPGIPTE
jgi:hypothetical protein